MSYVVFISFESVSEVLTPIDKLKKSYTNLCKHSNTGSETDRCSTILHAHSTKCWPALYAIVYYEHILSS
jgi:hypothetical protein